MAKKDYSQYEKKELIEKIEQLEEGKKYGLVWEDKTENVVKQCQTELPVLEEVKDKEIVTDKDKPTNILIEGDNYHALSVLNYTHAGKIDVIYIDPPYNTGSKDWKYNNNYVDDNDTYRHSKWISFMNHRLILAKNLLKETGILICTIDENEHAALGMLLQKLFADKEIVCVSIIHNPGGIQGKNFSFCHEYAYFVYPKGGRFIALQNREENPDIRTLRDVSKGNHLRENAKNCFYPILIKEGKIIGFGDVSDNTFHPNSSNIQREDGVIEVYPIDAKGNERKWVFARQSVESIKDELLPELNSRRQVWDIVRTKTNFNYKTVWTDPKYNANIFGTKILNNIIEGNFPFPKSLYAVMDCIRAAVHDKNNAIILDFFAGSGTTGHAVLELNKNDNGKRKFIICTNNEDNNGEGTKIANDICLPRISRVIKGYKGLNDNKIYEGLGSNLRYFTTDFVPKTNVSDDTKYSLVNRSTEMICLKEDTFEKVLDKDYIKIFQNNDQYTAILFHLEYFKEFKSELEKLDKPIHIYIFSLTNDTYDDDFKDIKQKFDLCPIPESILEVYRKIFKE